MFFIVLQVACTDVNKPSPLCQLLELGITALGYTVQNREYARLATADFEFMNCAIQQISIIKNIVSEGLVVSISDKQKYKTNS